MPSPPSSRLVWLLRGMAVVNLAAVIAVVAPTAWIAWCHRQIGLGPFPDAPIAGYLARSTSLWFASFGVFLGYIARDPARHAGVVTFLAIAMIVQGAAMLVVDWICGMPAWWILAEGPTCVMLGSLMLAWRPRSDSTST